MNRCRYHRLTSREIFTCSRNRMACAPDTMVRIACGTFRMDQTSTIRRTNPRTTVTVDGFWIDRYAVTNADCDAFVAGPATSRSPSGRSTGAVSRCATGPADAGQCGVPHAQPPGAPHDLRAAAPRCRPHPAAQRLWMVRARRAGYYRLTTLGEARPAALVRPRPRSS